MEWGFENCGAVLSEKSAKERKELVGKT